jgi:ornithine cyclodeaminase/alanine dehydrogenase-like protein (mu-crystallin family)
MAVHARHGGFHVKAAGLDLGRLYVAVKTNGNFPDNTHRHGLPTIQGVVVLCDADDGRPLAVMDSMELTLRRTAAASAVAARYLARPDSRTVAICGCGIQGRAHLRALTRVLPIERARAFDTDADCARRFAHDLSLELGIDVIPAAGLGEAAKDADVWVTCTTSREPFLGREHVAPGAFVAAVGADNEDKQELHPDLMGSALVVADVLDQCARIGELHHALDAGVLTRDAVSAELADVVTGARPGRVSRDDVTVFDSTGTALEDVAAAAIAYERAVAQDVGLTVALGG